MSEEELMAEEEELTPDNPEFDMYVCSSCGSSLTEIPYYNRFYCENCGLHY